MLYLTVEHVPPHLMTRVGVPEELRSYSRPHTSDVDSQHRPPQHFSIDPGGDGAKLHVEELAGLGITIAKSSS